MFAGIGMIVAGAFVMFKGHERLVRHQIQREHDVAWLGGNGVTSSSTEPVTADKEPTRDNHQQATAGDDSTG